MDNFQTNQVAGNPPQPETSTNNVASGVPTTSNHKKVGPIIAVLAVLLVLVIFGLYLAASSINKQIPTDDTGLPLDNSVQAMQTVIPVTNTADDPSSLQKDLDASLNGIDNLQF
jgi:hypothetical protein